jgi:hypothetical protein
MLIPSFLFFIVEIEGGQAQGGESKQLPRLRNSVVIEIFP